MSEFVYELRGNKTYVLQENILKHMREFNMKQITKTFETDKTLSITPSPGKIYMTPNKEPADINDESTERVSKLPAKKRAKVSQHHDN